MAEFSKSSAPRGPTARVPIRSNDITKGLPGDDGSDDSPIKPSGNRVAASQEDTLQTSSASGSALTDEEISQDNSDDEKDNIPQGVEQQQTAGRSSSVQPYSNNPVAVQRPEGYNNVVVGWLKEVLRTGSFKNFAALISFVFVFFAINYSMNKPTLDSPVAQQHCNKFFQLGSMFPNTDRILWNTLNVSVNRAVYRDPGEPATFIFLYDSSANGESLLDEVTKITSECFGGNEPIRLGSSYFQSAEIAQDSGLFISQYLTKLQAHGIMVVHDLDHIPPFAAKAFFPICDSYEPLVRKAVIFFTMDISHQPEQVINAHRSPTKIAEAILKTLWKEELHANVLDPLVVRLTENVFRIG